jgi:hypothetical protein
MRCPACDAQNPNDATRCSGCGKALPARARRRSADEPDAPRDPEAERRNAAALRAYRICLYGLVPGLGLVLGPVGLVLGVVARVRGAKVPEFTAGSAAMAAVLLGALITATQWVGATLMVVGWRGGP